MYKLYYDVLHTNKSWLSSKSWDSLVTKDTNLITTVDTLKEQNREWGTIVQIVKVDEEDNILEYVY